MIFLEKNWCLALISILLVEQVLGDNPSDFDKKFRPFEKQKLARSSQKKPIFSKSTKANEEEQTTTPRTQPTTTTSTENNPFSSDPERHRICYSLTEDTVPDFLTKFGLITHLIDDVNAFRAKVKSSRSRQLEKSQSAEDQVVNIFTKKTKKYTKSKLSKFNNAQSSTLLRSKSARSESSAELPKNHYLYSISRQGKNQETVPTCFGFEYLTALEAFDAATQTADIDVLQGLLSDMLSMNLTTLITDIFEQCSGREKTEETSLRAIAICPIVEFKRPEIVLLASKDNHEQTSEMRSACEESCFTDSDCGNSGQRCCPNDCGGHSCHVPQKWMSTRQRSLETECVKADAFMQCLYERVKLRVCQDKRE